jgi:putative ABC transport system permease protein
MVTGAGMARIQPDFLFSSFSVYLTYGTCPEEFTESIQSYEGDIFAYVAVLQDIIDGTIGALSGAFEAVTVAIMVAVAIITVVTTYMVIKTTILRRNREMGIQKALGFTTFQLINQIALGLTPSIILGTALAALVGHIGFNSLLSVFTRAVGVLEVDFPSPLGLIALLCVSLIFLAYLVSVLVARRIRKISAYALVSEG